MQNPSYPVMAGMANGVPFSRGNAQGGVTCHICGKVGHYARNCWSAGNGRPTAVAVQTGVSDDETKEMREYFREKIRKRRLDEERREREEGERRRKEEENRKELERMRDADAREARLEARLMRLLAQHTKTSTPPKSSGVKKKSPRTKARVLREMRSYFDESDDDSEEVREEAGKLVEVMEKRKGKGRAKVTEERWPKVRIGGRGDREEPVKLEDEEDRTPPPNRRTDKRDPNILDFVIELHRHLSEKKVPELRKLCNREGIEWSKRDTVIGELVKKFVLRDILWQPWRIRDLYKRSSREIIALFRTATLFHDKRSRNLIKTVVSKVARKKFGCEIRRRPCVQIPFSSEITAGLIAQAVPDQALGHFVSDRVRVVVKNRKTVEMIIHNHRACVSEEEVGCTCQSFRLPRHEGHVKVRLSEIEGIPAFMRNSNNVTCGIMISPHALETCMKRGIENWAKGKMIQVDRGDIEMCFRRGEMGGSGAMTTNAVRAAFGGLSRLVTVPIDQNPGASLILCPVLYLKACKDTFNHNPGFQLVARTEDQVLRTMREDYTRNGLTKVARWQSRGRMGQAYVLPKDKDIGRWRPISPCTFDPARVAAARIGKAIRYMLFGLPKNHHFDLRSTEDLVKKCGEVRRDMSQRYDEAIARSYDIKDMFSKLSHEVIIEAVDWLIAYHERRGMRGVKVGVRGKLVAMVKRVRKEDGMVAVSLEDLRKEVAYELSNSFVRCAGKLLAQRFGIPMGRNSSPALACLVCAKAEYEYMNREHERRSLVRGVRMIDDVMVIIGFRRSAAVSLERVTALFEEFERCYDENLALVRKDEGGNVFDFLGTRVIVSFHPIVIDVIPRTRNQQSLTEDGTLKVQSIQDFASLTRKAAKKATVYAALLRMSRISTTFEGMKVAIAALMMETRLRGLWSLGERVLGWFDPEGTTKTREGQKAGKEGPDNSVTGEASSSEGGLKKIVSSLARALNKNQGYLADAKKKLTFDGANITQFVIDYENLAALLKWTEEEKMNHLGQQVSLSLGWDIMPIVAASRSWKETQDVMMRKYLAAEKMARGSDLAAVQRKNFATYNDFLWKFTLVALRIPGVTDRIMKMIDMHLHDGSYMVDIEDPVAGRGELLRLLGTGGDPPRGKLATWSPSFEDSTRKEAFARMEDSASFTSGTRSLGEGRKEEGEDGIVAFSSGHPLPSPSQRRCRGGKLAQDGFRMLPRTYFSSQPNWVRKVFVEAYKKTIIFVDSHHDYTVLHSANQIQI
ncbi:hypothetical protein CBR_g40474 [Chara braunii]|uniref:CCHC-type domain-containing protein n=1 Tax=Chara braunii TaxID=69332 RepID=A0A388LU09_CHABU|nr:hypothetical protein CBR_g40474 [Chara braunii]|eukprot:GBG85745.1 hypothetical protein CBR_g40474 [Chara braunii]